MIPYSSYKYPKHPLENTRCFWLSAASVSSLLTHPVEKMVDSFILHPCEEDGIHTQNQKQPVVVFCPGATEMMKSLEKISRKRFVEEDAKRNQLDEI